MNDEAGSDSGGIPGDAGVAARRCRSLVSAVEGAVFDVDVDGTLGALEADLLSVTGHERSALEGAHASRILDEEAVTTLEQAIESREPGEVTAVDVTVTSTDGERVSADLRVAGDRSQLRQVFQNLLSNALEYSGDEPPRVRVGAVRAEVRRDVGRDAPIDADAAIDGPESGGDGAPSGAEGDEWIVSVSDQGIGIDREHQDRVFEVFQRLHSREDLDGTGIGLALCERIVERHGGRIWVESTPGEGSTFYFALPVEEERDG